MYVRVKCMHRRKKIDKTRISLKSVEFRHIISYCSENLTLHFFFCECMVLAVQLPLPPPSKTHPGTQPRVPLPHVGTFLIDSDRVLKTVASLGRGREFKISKKKIVEVQNIGTVQYVLL